MGIDSLKLDPVPLFEAVAGFTGSGWPVCTLAAVLSALGVCVWLFGERVLRPGMILLAGCVGAVAGSFFLPRLAPALGLHAPEALLAGLIAGAALAWISYRWVLALSFGALVAVVAAAALAFAADNGMLGSRGSGLAEKTSPALREIERRAILLEEFGAAEGADGLPLVARARSFWRDRSETQRGAIAAGAAAGLVLGLAAGLWRPRWAGVVVASLVGAAIWVPGVVWLSGRLELPCAALLERIFTLAPAAVGVVVLGAVIQARALIARAA